MGIWDNLFSRQRPAPAAAAERREIAVGAKDDNTVTITFNDKNITFTGDIAGYDYDNL